MVGHRLMKILMCFVALLWLAACGEDTDGERPFDKYVGVVDESCDFDAFTDDIIRATYPNDPEIRSEWDTVGRGYPGYHANRVLHRY